MSCNHLSRAPSPPCKKASKVSHTSLTRRTRLSCLTTPQGHRVFKSVNPQLSHTVLGPTNNRLLHPSPPRTRTEREIVAAPLPSQTKTFPYSCKAPETERACSAARLRVWEEARPAGSGNDRDGEGAQRDKEDREPQPAAVHLLQAQGRPLQEGQGARRPLRHRSPPPPLLRLRQALPLSRAHRPLCQGLCREVRGGDAHQSLVRYPPGEACRAREGGQDVRRPGEGAEVHDGGRWGAVQCAVAGGAGAQPGGGHAQGALREGPQDRRRDELPREHDQGKTSGALRVV